MNISKQLVNQRILFAPSSHPPAVTGSSTHQYSFISEPRNFSHSFFLQADLAEEEARLLQKCLPWHTDRGRKWKALNWLCKCTGPDCGTDARALTNAHRSTRTIRMSEYVHTSLESYCCVCDDIIWSWTIFYARMCVWVFLYARKRAFPIEGQNTETVNPVSWWQYIQKNIFWKVKADIFSCSTQRSCRLKMDQNIRYLMTLRWRTSLTTDQ